MRNVVMFLLQMMVLFSLFSSSCSPPEADLENLSIDEHIEMLGEYTFEHTDPRSPHSLGPANKELISRLTGLPHSAIFELELTQTFDDIAVQGSELVITEPAYVNNVNDKLWIFDDELGCLFEADPEFGSVKLIFDASELKDQFIGKVLGEGVKVLSSHEYVFVYQDSKLLAYRDLYDINRWFLYENSIYDYKDGEYLFDIYDLELKQIGKVERMSVFGEQGAKSEEKLNRTGEPFLCVSGNRVLQFNRHSANYAIFDLQANKYVAYVDNRFEQLKRINRYRDADEVCLPQFWVSDINVYEEMFYLLFTPPSAQFICSISTEGEIVSAYLLPDFGEAIGFSFAIIDTPEKGHADVFITKAVYSESSGSSWERSLLKYNHIQTKEE